MVKGETDFYKIKSEWHPDQMINLWDSFTGGHWGWCYVKDLDPEQELEADFVEPVDEYGQYVIPKLK